MILDVLFRDEDGHTVGKLVATEKTFSTGSRGLFAQGKLEIDGKRYQVQVQLVEIGSKTGKQETAPAS